MTDRIKLAEAMGRDPAMYAPNFDIPIFDPFTDANDDYAVLEWMKSEQFYPLEGYDYTEWLFAINNALKLKMAIDYKIGDYARAALKALKDQT